MSLSRAKALSPSCLPTLLLRLAVVLCLIGTAAPRPILAQQAAPYSLDLRGLPLDLALKHLLATIPFDLAYDPSLVAGRRTSCSARAVDAEGLLRCVLAGTGVDFIRRSSGTYVLVPVTESRPVYGRLTGIVVDAETGLPLPRAHVFLTQAATQAAANEAGMFTFAGLKPGRYEVRATYIGYESGTALVTVPPGGSTSAELALQASPMLVAPIVVDGLQWRLPSSALGRAATSNDDPLVPGPAADDVLRSLDALMGLRVNDATADVHVQGGETGEHQFRLDGAPVFIPIHSVAFVGPFSPFAIGRITVHKAGFGAALGSQIAGVIDARHDLSTPGSRRLDVQVDPLSFNARLHLERRDEDGAHTALSLAGRVGLWNLYAPTALDSLLHAWNTNDPFLVSGFARGNIPFGAIPPSTGDPGIGFHDLHGAARVRFGPLSNLHVSAYWGENRLGSDRPDGLNTADAFAGAPSSYRDLYTWQTGIVQSRFESVLGKRTLASVRVRGSFYRLAHDYFVPGDDPATEDDGNSVRELALETTLDHALDHRHNLEGGLELAHTLSRFSILGAQRFSIDHTSSSWRLASFVEDEIALGASTTLTLGSRFTFVPTHRAVFAEPRASFRYDHSESAIGDWSLFLGTGLYRQFVNQFDVSSRSPRLLLSSTRFWMAVDSTVAPPRAAHLAAELLLRPSPSWTIRLEGYYKAQSAVLAIDYASQAVESQSGLVQRDFLKSSRGTVRGAAALIERSFGASRARIRYEFTAAERGTDDLFGGALKSAPWNEPHRLEMGFDLSFLRSLTLVARWRGIWGRTWGFRRSYYDYLGAYYRELQDLADIGGVSGNAVKRISDQIDRFRLTDPDQHRLPPIYQLDASLAYARRMGPMNLQARIDVLNVMNRNNVADWHLYFDPEVYYGEQTSGFLSRGERHLLPRLLSLALRASW